MHDRHGLGSVIEVHALRKTYRGGLEAVKDIDFEVAPARYSANR